MRVFGPVAVLLLCVSLSAGAQQTYKAEEQFLAYTDHFHELGKEWARRGYFMQADWYYAQATVAVESLQYTLITLSRKQYEEAAAARKQARDEADRAERKAMIEEGPAEVDEDTQELAAELFGVDLGGLMTGLHGMLEKTDQMVDKLDEVAPVIEEGIKQWGESILGPIEWDEWKVQRSQMWEQISTKSIASPWPWFFEAFTDLCLGLKEDAAEPLAVAMLNPYLPEEKIDFAFLQTLSRAEIRDMYYRLDAKRAEYEDRLGSTVECFIPRSWENFNYANLAMKGRELLEDDQARYPEAAPWFVAAVKAFPFDANLFCAAASLLCANGDLEAAVNYINIGLRLDPNNENLQSLVSDLKADLL